MTQDAPDAAQAANDVPAKAERPAMSDAALRRYIDERFSGVDDQFAAGDLRMKRIEDSIAVNTELTSGIRDLLDTGRTGLKVLGWLGEGLKWAAKIATPIVALWGLYNSTRHGAPPPK